MALETALHLLGRASALVGLALLLPLACCVLAGSPHAPPLLVASASCLSWGWGLRLACASVPGALQARARRTVLAVGAALALLLAALPWLLDDALRRA